MDYHVTNHFPDLVVDIKTENCVTGMVLMTVIIVILKIISSMTTFN